MFNGVAEQAVGENFFSYLLRIWALPTCGLAWRLFLGNFGCARLRSTRGCGKTSPSADRTLTDNPQLSEIISAIKPQEKPVELRLDSAMLRVAADNASRAALIEEYGMGAQPPEKINYPPTRKDVG